MIALAACVLMMAEAAAPAQDLDAVTARASNSPLVVGAREKWSNHCRKSLNYLNIGG